MALALCNLLQHKPIRFHNLAQTPTSKFRPKTLHFHTKSTNPKFSLLPRKFTHISPLKSASINGYTLPNSPDEEQDIHNVESELELWEKVRRWIGFLPAILPGGSWWRFSEQVDVVFTSKPVTLWRALRRMWGLVAEDRWVIFAAFSALILTALSEISIPHFLTASIFSAQSGQVAVFHRNVRLLVLLCIISGICRLKS